MSTWNILYRGSLSSCNYSCHYCPFAKRANSRAELRQDELELEGFVAWVARQTHRVGVLITPWGEALLHQYYRRAMTELSRLPQVYRIAIQTNLSAPLDDFADADRDALALWATFHPTQTSLSRFVAQCHKLDDMQIRYSVGAVGVREQFDLIEQLRHTLRSEVYLWVNAYKLEPDYYRPAEITRLLAVDPYFHWNVPDHPSIGRACDAGHTTFTVDARGDVRRCHFIDNVIGNIYDSNFTDCLKPRLCSAATCACHIGYIHLQHLNLRELYGRGLVERIPANWPDLQNRFLYTAAGSAVSARARTS